MSDYKNTSNPIGVRLKQEMKKQGINTVELARRSGLLTSFFYDVISGKSHNPSIVKLAKVAEILDIDLDYLVRGKDDNLDTQTTKETNRDYISIPRIYTRDSHNGSNIITHSTDDNTFLFHKDWIKNVICIDSTNLRCFVVGDDSMIPTMQHDDIVLLDLSKNTPSPPGIFVLFDGLGLTTKRLEYFTEPSRSRIRVIPDNQYYSAYECSISDVTIIGRVVWFSRKT